eukprot:CAMPEP_0183308418 /NCGR_PEP_ID=MMETSP0160_2-20130417/21928_1 /TAXON_ID=2839 ORGANISM="Odontella Sinensis, Strain Grunow 1884" /NCGR_SAMPLE_ID=MMETSP0160_2 /ASSEMBLY_ACC=CAM_ASM_000250 /LENGTH=144 /DNA_ID=CAMNT_0025472259 /DNA_START=266 /DNA_END=700 /DNA_ORIENTATION=+
MKRSLSCPSPSPFANVDPESPLFFSRSDRIDSNSLRFESPPSFSLVVPQPSSSSSSRAARVNGRGIERQHLCDGAAKELSRSRAFAVFAAGANAEGAGVAMKACARGAGETARRKRMRFWNSIRLRIDFGVELIVVTQAPLWPG